MVKRRPSLSSEYDVVTNNVMEIFSPLTSLTEFKMETSERAFPRVFFPCKFSYRQNKAEDMAVGAGGHAMDQLSEKLKTPVSHLQVSRLHKDD